MAERKNTSFERPGGYAMPKGATIVQRHPAGLVRVVGGHGVLRYDGLRWHHEPPVWSWIDTLTAFPGDGRRRCPARQPASSASRRW